MNSKLTAVVSRDGKEIYRISDLTPRGATEMRVAINAHDELVSALRAIVDTSGGERELRANGFDEFADAIAIGNVALAKVAP